MGINGNLSKILIVRYPLDSSHHYLWRINRDGILEDFFLGGPSNLFVR